MANKRKSDGKLVLIVGSSIAQYGTQTWLLESHLKKITGQNIKVEIITHASLFPSDLRYYSGRINRLYPDLIVYISNPADFDIERYSPPHEAGFDYPEDAEIRYLSIRRPALVYYPVSLVNDYARSLGLEKSASFLARGFFYGLRFREEWKDALTYNLTNDYKRNYDTYQGIRIPEGIHRDGTTGACFSFPSSLLNSFYFRFDHRLLSADQFQIEFYEKDSQSNTQKNLESRNAEDLLWDADVFTDPSMHALRDEAVLNYLNKEHKEIFPCSIKGSAPVFIHRPVKSGWQTVTFKTAKPEIFVRLSHVLVRGKIEATTENTISQDGRGIRLENDFGLKERRKNDIKIRRRFLDDIRVHRMNQKDYREDYKKRLQPDDWESEEKRSLSQLNYLRLSKYYLHFHSFREIFQFREWKKFRQKTNSKILFINAPENPVNLEEYTGSSWYRDYRNYLKNEMETSKGRYFTVDLSESGREQDFVDVHHLSYDGMIKFSGVYASYIAKALAE